MLLAGHVEALSWMTAHVRSMDRSLLRQFCMGLVGGLEPPMSLAVVRELLTLLSDAEVQVAIDIMLGILKGMVDEERKQVQQRAVSADPASAQPSASTDDSSGGERARKRLRRMNDDDGDSNDEPMPDPLPVVASSANAAQVNGARPRRPQRTKAFLSDSTQEGSGEELDDVRAFAAFLVDLHSALTAHRPLPSVYIDDGSVNADSVLQQLDAFLEVLKHHHPVAQMT